MHSSTGKLHVHDALMLQLVRLQMVERPQHHSSCFGRYNQGACPHTTFFSHCREGVLLMIPLLHTLLIKVIQIEETEFLNSKNSIDHGFHRNHGSTNGLQCTATNTIVLHLLQNERAKPVVGAHYSNDIHHPFVISPTSLHIEVSEVITLPCSLDWTAHT